MSCDPYRRILKALKTILDHYDATLEPVRRAPGSRVDTSHEAPLPISADVLDKRAQCRMRLASNCLMVITERDLHTEGLSGHDVPAMCDLLRRHADWLSTHESADVVVWDLEASAKDLRGIAAPYRKDWQNLGACPLEVDSENGLVVCGGQVRAYPDKDPKCQSCGEEAVTTWWEERMFADPELRKLLTADELVTFIHKQFGRPVTKVAIRQWVARGIITKADTNDKGQTLYDRGAVAYSLERRKILA